jgi:hypothetical protein
MHQSISPFDPSINPSRVTARFKIIFSIFNTYPARFSMLGFIVPIFLWHIPM